MTKKLLAVALLAAGLTVGCGDEDVLSPGALDAAGDVSAADAPVNPGSDTMPGSGSDGPAADVAIDAPASPDAGVDATSTADADVADAADQADAADGVDAESDADVI